MMSEIKLLDAKECAERLRFKESYFKKNVSKRETFPTPINFNAGGKKPTYRWIKEEFEAWIEAQKELRV